MADKMVEMILEQLFKMQEKMLTKDDLKNFATKDDLKNFATKDDLKKLEERMDNKFATKDDLEAMEVRIEKKFDEKLDIRFEKQTKEIAEELRNIYSLTERNRIKMAVEFDKKIGQLRKEFVTASK